MFNIVQRRKWYFLFSGVIISAGLIAMIISIAKYPEHSPIRLGVDFTGGSLFEVHFVPTTNQTGAFVADDAVKAEFEKAGLQDVRIQRLLGLANSVTGWQVRTSFIAEGGDVLKTLGAGLGNLAATNNYKFDQDFFDKNQNRVSPTIGGEVTTAALIATIVASLLVLGWIAFAFRQVTNSFRYGTCAVLAMIHDILVMVGVMSIMGLVLGWEADSLFLTGLLTVVGYSVQDTIVVFDRIRENAVRHRGEPYEMVINRSIMETIQRSLAIQLTVGFVLSSLFLLGGSAIRVFVGTLLIGLLSGTYSSTFTAIPLLVAWEKGQLPFVNRTVSRAH